MRSFLIAGVIILGLGGFVLLRGGTFDTRRDVVKVGDVRISTESRQAIPTWLGWAAVVTGVVLVGAGMRRAR